jgi:hypothetical protein
MHSPDWRKTPSYPRSLRHCYRRKHGFSEKIASQGDPVETSREGERRGNTSMEENKNGRIVKKEMGAGVY